MSSCKNYLPGFNFNAFDNTHLKELAKAVENESIEEIEYLVKLRKIEIDYLEPEYGHSLLMLAVANNLKKSTKKLLELGANPNLKSNPLDINSVEITTPMFIACDKIINTSSCELTILSLLIHYGGNVNDELEVQYVGNDYKSKETVLMIACKYDCLEIVNALVKAGADIDKYDYKEGLGPISNAIIYDRMEILRYLIIEKKANIPKYCFVIQSHNETPRKEYTVSDMLLKKNYNEESNDFKIKSEILAYLKGK